MLLTQIIFILILISLNGFFALAELAILSTNKLRLTELADRGDDRAQAALELAQNSTSFLSNVQIGITLVGAASGTIGGATIADSLASALRGIALIGEYADGLSIVLVILSITLLSVVIGELVPKRIALSDPEQFALRVAPPIRSISKIFSPISNLLSHATDTIVGWMGIDIEEQPQVSLEELRLTIDAGASIGILEPIEEIMLEQVLRFNDIEIQTLATPRVDIAWIDINASQEEIREFLSAANIEKIPVSDGDLDNIKGIVYVQKLLATYLRTGQFDIAEALIPAVLVPKHMTLLQSLEEMRASQANLVFVINEYGGVDGLVSTKDILETIAGDLPEPDEDYDPQIVQREDGSWLLDGMLILEIFSELINVDVQIIQKTNIKTVAGFVLTQLKKMPRTGDRFSAFGYSFEVVDMDNNRIDKVLVTREDQ